MVFIIRLIHRMKKTMLITTFEVNYRAVKNSGKNHRESLCYAMDFFRYRFPFNQLTDADMENLYNIAEQYDDTTGIVEAYQLCENKQDIRPLKDIEGLKMYIYLVRKRRGLQTRQI